MNKQENYRSLLTVNNAVPHSPALITHINRDSLAPFVLFDAGAMERNTRLSIDWHPHSGVATVTFPYSSDLHHADSHGNDGVIRDGGLQWMASGSGVWHKEIYQPHNGRIGIHQLWILLPPEEETAPVRYFNLQANQIPVTGNTRVLLGEYQGIESPAEISQDVSYFDISLKAGEKWSFSPPITQTRGFVFPRLGQVSIQGTMVGEEQLGQFEESDTPIEIIANSNTSFVVALAQPWKHPIVHEYGQMHTSRKALESSRKVITLLGNSLKKQQSKGEI